MPDPRFENPIWHTLTGAHAEVAIGAGAARRYPAPILPFVAVERADALASAALDAITASGDVVYLVGVQPPLSPSWRVEHESVVLQLACGGAIDAGRDVSPLHRLGAADVPDMLALTALAYPGFFRAGTASLGDFRGIRVEGVLVSLVGTRMRFGDWVELTTICTHPDFAGRGYSRHLVSALVADLLAAGLQPFLHVEADNHHAVDLYQRWGFQQIGQVHMKKLLRR